jgi:hypothetical protein
MSSPILKKLTISFIFLIFTIIIITITNSSNFLTGNYETILTLSVLFIGLLVIFSMLDIHFDDNNKIENDFNDKNNIFNKDINYKVKENLDTIKPSSNFCDPPNGSLLELNKKCEKLTKESCNVTSCCIWLNGEKCATGNELGPTFLTDENKNKINVDYYYYKNKCNGKGCP